VLEDLLVRRREGLIQAEVDGELVALHIDNGTCYGFNATATRIWALIETPQRLLDLKDKLLAEYDVDPQTCERQLMAVLNELAQDGLVELQPASAQ
jgi:coenzyme PQQ synthesis protein D (PqqD)